MKVRVARNELADGFAAGADRKLAEREKFIMRAFEEPDNSADFLDIAEFLNTDIRFYRMAADLLYIKSRMLLPVDVEFDEEYGEAYEDEGLEFSRRGAPLAPESHIPFATQSALSTTLAAVSEGASRLFDSALRRGKSALSEIGNAARNAADRRAHPEDEVAEPLDEGAQIASEDELDETVVSDASAIDEMPAQEESAQASQDFEAEDAAELGSTQVFAVGGEDEKDATVASTQVPLPGETVAVPALSAEQEALSRADLIVWQHPMQWYSIPPLLKLWIDKVFSHGWAYGHGGTALHGKHLLWAVTTGGGESHFEIGAHPGFDVLSQPLQATAIYCGLNWLPPFAMHCTFICDDETLEGQARHYKQRLLEWQEAHHG